MTTKHTTECIHHGMPLLANGSVCNCPCHTAPDGTGVRERLRQFTERNGGSLDGVDDFIDSELSRLHSQIVEGIAQKQRDFANTPLDERKNGFDSLSEAKEIVNQAFNDLRGGENN